ncbi:hypothetical protein B0T18DRAFT_424318 [Schizothecium vesticola]|uniref:Uncharacterized protein n=1 Tax=Schizothecium vesticola TaxID=314040 RepID=A0AA40F9Q9_9PEZI|nr:hypothetical protein B0T18DRAFT_424318 [Schizothecium vesticola]
MVSSTLALPATAWLVMLLTVASAATIPAPLFARQSQESLSSTSSSTQLTASTPSPSPTGALAPWVSVDESGTPKTITPFLTTISGTPTTISPAPFAVTATVSTQTRPDAKLTTTTGPGPAAPQATNPNGSGAFAICTNTDPSALAPFCSPENNATLHPGVTHYVTWNPTFFPVNTTVRVVGFYANSTSDPSSPDEAFSSNLLPAAWGFYQWPIAASLYTTPPHLHPSGVNITLRIAALPPTGGPRAWLPGPTVLVAPKPTPPPQKTGPPTGPALYIGLPCVLAFVVLMVGGTCWWNRRERMIGVGNVMGRGRRGYGVGKSRRERVRKAGIKLEETTRGAAGYRDQPTAAAAPAGGDGWDDESWRREPIVVGVARRDSDALGSLAGSPTKEDFPRGGGGGNNVFRDELGRQQESRDFRAELERRKY